MSEIYRCCPRINFPLDLLHKLRNDYSIVNIKMYFNQLISSLDDVDSYTCYIHDDGKAFNHYFLHNSHSSTFYNNILDVPVNPFLRSLTYNIYKSDNVAFDYILQNGLTVYYIDIEIKQFKKIFINGLTKKDRTKLNIEDKDNMCSIYNDNNLLTLDYVISNMSRLMNISIDRAYRCIYIELLCRTYIIITFNGYNYDATQINLLEEFNNNIAYQKIHFS